MASAGASADQGWSYTYNEKGKLLTQDGPRTDLQDVTTNTYQTDGTTLASTTDAKGLVTTFNTYDALGHLTAFTDPNGITTLLEYHIRGWLTKVTVKHPGGDVNLNAVTQYEYDPVGNLIKVTLPNGLVTNYEYNGANYLTAVYNAAGERIDYTYDLAGNRTGESIKNSVGTLRYSLGRTFDELSRVLDITGNNGQQTHHGYDVNDNPTSQRDAKQHTTQQQFDALDRVKKIIDPKLGETTITYTPGGQIDTVTDARGKVTDYDYNAFGDLTRLSSPDTGVTTFTYDDASNRKTRVDARGVETRYEYDALNRLTSIQYPASPTENVTYSYDAGTRGKGRLTGIVDSSGNTAYLYNYLGQVIQKNTSILGKTYSTFYGYDLAGFPTQITYPTGRLVNYQYNAQRQITGITTKANNTATTTQTLMSNGQYLPFGPLEKLTYGNGITETRQYDNDYRAQSIQTQGPFAVLDVVFGYDPADNLNSLQNRLTTSQSQAFDYDELDRLKTASGAYGALSFQYDEVGNRLEKLLSASGTTTKETYQIDPANNRLKGVTVTVNGAANAGLARSFTYDTAGNLQTGTLNGQLAVVDTNDGNRAESISLSNKQITQYYNALGQRVRKSVNQGGSVSSEHYLYDEAGRLIAVTNPAGDILNEIIWLGNQPIAANLATSTAITATLTTPDSAPNPGDSIALTSSIQGGNGQPVEYRLRLKTPGSSIWTTPKDWSTTSSYTWAVPSTLGSYTWELSARNQGSTNVTTATGTTQVVAPLQHTAQLSSNQLAPGASYTLTSTSTGGLTGGQYLYRIRLKGPSTNNAYVTLRDWTSTASYTASIPSTAGAYTLEVSALQYNTNSNLATVTLPVTVKTGPIATPSNGTTSISQVGIVSTVASATGAGTLEREIYSIHTDHLGTPRALSNSAGKLVWQWQGQPFGETLPNQDPDGDRKQVVFNLRFAGQYFDSETGLSQNYFRDYDPNAGRYTQSDPIGLKGGINTYAYVSGNPLNYADPYGLFQFGQRGLNGLYPGPRTNGNAGIYHEHGFYQDGSGDNVGYFGSENGGRVGPDFGYPANKNKYMMYPEIYDDSTMRKAQERVKNKKYNLFTNNCQDYADRLREEYKQVKQEEFIHIFGPSFGIPDFGPQLPSPEL